MRLLGKLIATSVIIIGLIVTLLLCLLQSQYAKPLLTQYLHRISPYRIELAQIDYDLQTPWQIDISQPTLYRADDTETPLISAEQIALWLSPSSLTKWRWHFDSVLISGLEQTSLLSQLPDNLSADRLALEQLTYHNEQLKITQANIQLDNWYSSPQWWLSFKGDFQLKAKQVTWRKQVLDNALVDGDKTDEHWRLYGFSFNWQQAGFNGQAEYQQQTNALTLHQLTISDLQWQPKQPLNRLWAEWSAILPAKIHIKRFDLFNTSIESPELVTNHAALSLHNWHWPEPLWQQNAKLSFSATDMLWHGVAFNQPLLNLSIAPQQITIEGASIQLFNGYLQTQGTLTPEDLLLDNISIKGVELAYQSEWQELLPRLDHTFNNISISELDVSHLNLLYPDPALAIQLNNLNMKGNDLVLRRRQQWGLWQGQLTVDANYASINGITLSSPYSQMQASRGEWQVEQLILPFDDGLLEGQAHIELATAGQPWQLSAKGDSLPSKILAQWLRLPLPLDGEIDINIEASGLAQNRPSLNHSLTGQLNAEFRQQIASQSAAQLWQHWSEPSKALPSPSQSDTPVTISPLMIKADRGRLQFSPLTLNTDGLTATLDGQWDMAGKESATLHWRAQHSCQTLDYPIGESVSLNDDCAGTNK